MRRRTALTRLVLVQVALLCLVLAASLALGYAMVRHRLLDDARVAVKAAFEDLRIGTELRRNELLYQLPQLARSAREQRSGMLYLLTDAAGMCPVSGARCPIGNLRAWPDGIPKVASSYQVRLEVPIALSVFNIDRLGLILLVGREIRGLDELDSQLAPTLAATAAVAVLLAAVPGFLAARRLLARISAINDFCGVLDAGALDTRLDTRGSDEFSDLSANINGMLDRIRELVHLVQQVTNHAAHDLRTPLTALRVGLEAGLGRTQDPAAQETLGEAIERLDALLEMFSRLLEIARSEAGSREGFETVDLAEVLRPTLAMFAPMAEDAGLHLQADLQPAVLPGVPELLQVLLANLLGNAIKFSPPGGNVRVRTSGANGTVRLSVADAGPGIPTEDRERVFRRYVRGSLTLDRPGYGLGLPLVRAIAGRHGLGVQLQDARPGLRVVVSGPSAPRDL